MIEDTAMNPLKDLSLSFLDKCDDCFWLKIHQDLRPCRGCDENYYQYITEEEMKKRKYDIVLESIKTFYNNISDEEFKQRLINLGFEIIKDGKGKLIYTEEDTVCPKCGGTMDEEGLGCMYCGFSYC